MVKIFTEGPVLIREHLFFWLSVEHHVLLRPEKIDLRTDILPELFMMIFIDLKTHYVNGGFGNVYLFALDNIKS